MQTNRGFTLIEVLIVVAIISILAAIALPQYNDYVVRSQLPEAYGELAAMRTKLEQYYLDNRTYEDACAPGTVAPLPTGKYFDFTCDLAATTYTVEADGKDGEKTAGFTFTINEANVRATTDVPADSGWSTNAGCWVIRKGSPGC